MEIGCVVIFSQDGYCKGADQTYSYVIGLGS